MSTRITRVSATCLADNGSIRGRTTWRTSTAHDRERGKSPPGSAPPRALPPVTTDRPDPAASPIPAGPADLPRPVREGGRVPLLPRIHSPRHSRRLIRPLPRLRLRPHPSPPAAPPRSRPRAPTPPAPQPPADRRQPLDHQVAGSTAGRALLGGLFARVSRGPAGETHEVVHWPDATLRDQVLPERGRPGVRLWSSGGLIHAQFRRADFEQACSNAARFERSMH